MRFFKYFSLIRPLFGYRVIAVPMKILLNPIVPTIEVTHSTVSVNCRLFRNSSHCVPWSVCGKGNVNKATPRGYKLRPYFYLWSCFFNFFTVQKQVMGWIDQFKPGEKTIMLTDLITNSFKYITLEVEDF